MVRRIFPALVLLAGTATAPDAQITDAFPNLAAFNLPIAVAAPDDGSGRLFVAERDGRIYVFDNDPTVSQRTLFLDISVPVITTGECGLLAFAFHPDYASNGYLYVTYTANAPLRTIVARFTAGADPDVADAASELPIIELTQSSFYHKGGCVTFGPDGYLYLSVGDDTGADQSQNLALLKGKVLRIDVDHPSGGLAYGIPPDNPLAGNTSGYREEIWAYGFRNPWRFSIDAPTGRLWLADVGQNEWEEVDIVRKGRNYGWPRMEGNECYSPPSCDTTGLDLDAPLYTYFHDQGSAAITGGHVYRGPSQSALFGKYLYADQVTGEIVVLSWDGVNPPLPETLPQTLSGIASFGVDDAGEVYVVSMYDGTIYRFDTTTSVGAPALRSTLTVTPNPFESHTALAFNLDERANLVVEIYDVRGRLVRRLVDEPRAAGALTVAWDGRDDRARAVAAGVYFGRVSVNGNATAVARMVRLR